MNAIRTVLAVIVVLVGGMGTRLSATQSSTALLSVDTGYTISKVRMAQARHAPYVVASSYEGTVLGIALVLGCIYCQGLSI